MGWLASIPGSLQPKHPFYPFHPSEPNGENLAAARCQWEWELPVRRHIHEHVTFSLLH